ncbi:MAG: Ig-like domain-containing protein [Syntrophobacteraceae bacterium]
MKQGIKTIILSVLIIQVLVATAIAGPAPPKNIQSFAGEGFIKVTWDPAPDPTVRSYRVYKRAGSTDYSREKSYSISGLSLRDHSVEHGATAFYVVKAVDEAGNEGDPSIETAITYFNLERRSYYDLVNKKRAPIAAHTAAVGDLDGDGKPDLVLGTSKGVKIVFGCDTHSTPTLTLTGEKHGGSFGQSLSIADLNRDGFDDLIVGAPDSDGSPWSKGHSDRGKVYVYSGGRPFSTRPSLVLSGSTLRGRRLGTSMAAVGDVNGDGYADVAIGAPGGGLNRRGSLLLLLGGTTIADRTIEVAGPEGADHFGRSVAAAADVDRDGWRDILVGASGPSDKGRVHVIRGGTAPKISDLFLEGGPRFGRRLAGLDFNGDGFSDIVVGSSESEPTRVYFGPLSLHDDPDMALAQGKGFVGSPGDLDGDGFDDLALAACSVALGNSVGDNLVDLRWKSGCRAIGIGDVDGNGAKEVIAGCTAAAGKTVTAYSLAQVANPPSITLTHPHDLSTVDTRSLLVRGTVKDHVSSLVVKGQPVPFSADGSFEGAITLNPGPNVIEILAETAEHRITKRTLHVACSGPSGLSVDIVSPQDGSVVHSDSITVTGTVSDPSATVEVNGVPATLSDTRFEATVSVAPGENLITVSAQSSNGSVATSRITIRLEAQAPAVGLTATPDRITLGQSAVLCWSSTNADSASFDQGIGTVETSGTLTVSPTVTTGYTISVTGPGGSDTATVTVAVDQPAPVVTLSALPDTIHAGEGSTLSWISDYATAWSLEPGIGEVQGSGTLRITPMESTAYTLTASGPGGSATVSAIVTVTNSLPIANEDSADTSTGTPLTLNVLQNDFDPDGDPLHVASATQGDHGTVTLHPDSSVTYAPFPGFAGTDSFTCTITDSLGGFASAAVRVTVHSPSTFVIMITSPMDGTSTSNHAIQVTGTITNPSGIEFGVTVNGVPGVVTGDQFAASDVPLMEGQNTITAVATDLRGNAASISLAMLREHSGDDPRLYAVHYSGVVPFETVLGLEASHTVSDPYLSWTGPGQVDLLQAPEPNLYKIRINDEGIYHFTLTVNDAKGEPSSSTIVIFALGRVQMDGMLTSKWREMRSRLESGDLEAALGLFLERSRERYRSIFTSVESRLPTIASQMEDIEMMQCRNGAAEYRIKRVHMVNGQPVTISYSIFFRLDERGLWKIDKF